jgi:arginase
MTIRLILVPYHLGHRNVGLGAGPVRILDAGLAHVLDEAEHSVAVTTVELPEPPQHEIGATFHLNRRLAGAVEDAVAAGEFPLILAGNCSSCIGTLAGVGGDVGLVWFDAHGDFNTPETSASGFFDGMALNVAVGGSWSAAASTVPGFKPVAQATCALLGVRDLDPGEQELLERSEVLVASYVDLHGGELEHEVNRCLDAVANCTQDVYIHVDLDVLNRDLVPANEFSPPGGLTPTELRRALGIVAKRFNVHAAALTAYNPEQDHKGLGLAAATAVIEQLAEIGERGRERSHCRV